MIGNQPSDPPALRDRRILVVDDNIDAATSLAELLTLMGNEVRCIHDGAEVLQLVREYRPDIVLLDIGLPGMSGYNVARDLRREWGNGGMLIIAVSGYGSQEHRRRSMESGCDAHFVKPISLAELQAFAATRGA